MSRAKNGMKICANPKCIHNGEPQPVSNFHKNKCRADGYHHWCKDCNLKAAKKYREENAEDIREKSRQYWQKHAEERKEKCKRYRRENSEKVKEYNRNHAMEPAKYDSYFDKLSKYEECRRDPDNPDFLQVRCKYSECREWFNPTNGQVHDRLGAINGLVGHGGDSNFYCSEECKQKCPIYNKRKHIGSKILENSRPLQGELRKIVLERDDYTCCKCGRSKKEFPNLVLICHHIDPVANNPIESADIDNCATYCSKCHMEIHKTISGCGHAELRKCSENLKTA